MSLEPKPAPTPRPAQTSPMFEALETRSMMAAQPIAQAPATSELKSAALRVSLVQSDTQPAGPSLTVRALSPDQVRLTWTPTEGAVSYRIERFVGKHREWRDIGNTTETSAISYKLKGNRLYRYHIVAIDAAGAETAGEIVSIRPDAALAHASARAGRIVDMVEAFRAQQTEFVLEHINEADDLDFRRVVRRDQNNFAAQMLEMGVVYRPMSVDTLMPANMVGAAPRVSTVPPTVTMTVRSANELGVAWTAASGGLAYKVERSTDSGSNWAVLAFSTGLQFVDVGLTPDTSYQYRVSAITAADTSSPSVTATAVTNQVAPSALAATTASDTTINLTWTAVTNATSYRIERSVNNTTFTALVPGTALTGSDTSYSDTTATAGTTYYYRIVTINGGRSSAASTPVAVSTKTVAPTVTGVGQSGTRIGLTWTALATAFEYTVERSDDAGDTWAEVAKTTAARFVDADALTPDTEYVYRVSATNAGGTSAASAEVTVSTLLATVTGFTATPAADADKVTLDWTVVDNATTYRIDRSLNQTTWTTLSTTLADTDDTFDDTTVLPGKTYYYRMMAVNAAGTGAMNDAISALVRPATPGSVTATLTTATSVTLAWAAAPTATAYLVEKSDDAGDNWTTVGTPSGLTIVDSGLAANTPLLYRVSATNATGTSDASGDVAITTAPEAVTGFAGSYSDTDTQNELAWTAVDDATGYVIERSVAGGDWATISGSSALSGTDEAYDDTAITAGVSYRYRISAINASGTSAVSSIVTVLTEPAVPTIQATPTGATAISVSWSTSASATAYTLQFSDDAGDNWTDAYTGPNTTYSKTGLTANTPYSFQVLATNATGDSEYSTPVAITTLLAAPANFAATTPNGTSVVLAWDESDDATTYKIERSANAGSTWSTVNPSVALAGSDETYTDAGLTPNTAYQYRLSAVNGNGASAPTTAVSITTRVGTPATLTALATSNVAIGLTWTAVTGATTYKVETSADAGTTWAVLATQAGLTYSNAGLSADTTYLYRVTAIGTAGAGVATAPVAGQTLLNAPAGFAVAAPSATSATLTWTSVGNATGYRIDRSANAGVAWTTIVPSPALTGNANTYTDTTLTANTSYQYRIAAVGTAGSSANTAAATVLTRTLAPVATGTVTSASQVTLNWAAVTGASSYLVQRSTDGTNWTNSGTPTLLTQNVTGLTANTTYQFRVFAVNASGNSAASNGLTLKTMVAAPTGLATTAVTATSITLGWTATAGATSYKLEKAVGAGAFAVVTPTTPFTGSSAAYTDSTLVAGTTYKYRISAINTLGTSATSSELTVITKAATPVVTATTQSLTQINLAWPAIASATTYKVEISTDAGSTWAVAATPGTNSYNATGLNADSAYSFRVSAVNASGAGVASTVVATRTLLNAPVGLEALDSSSNSVTLAWTQSENATSYVIERSANSGTTWTPVVPTTALTGTDTGYEDVGLAGGTAYQYRLIAVNAAGRSAVSSTVSATTLAGAPTLTAAATSGTTVNLTWTAQTTATSYRVERSANAGSTWTTIGSPTTTAFTDTGVQAARNYSYRVSAVNAAGSGTPSAEVAVSTLLAAPTGLSVSTASATALNLSWTAPTGATGYKIERSTDTNSWTVVTQSPVLGGTSTFFSNTGLTAGTSYYFRITATGPGTIVSPTSASVRGTTLLVAPTGLAAVAASTTTINVSWTNTSNFNRLSYKLQRSPNGTNSWSTIATPAATATTYANSGLSGKTRYYYRLIAVSVAGDSAPGTVVNATTK